MRRSRREPPELRPAAGAWRAGPAHESHEAMRGLGRRAGPATPASPAAAQRARHRLDGCMPSGGAGCGRLPAIRETGRRVTEPTDVRRSRQDRKERVVAGWRVSPSRPAPSHAVGPALANPAGGLARGSSSPEHSGTADQLHRPSFVSVLYGEYKLGDILVRTFYLEITDCAQGHCSSHKQFVVDLKTVAIVDEHGVGWGGRWNSIVNPHHDDNPGMLMEEQTKYSQLQGSPTLAIFVHYFHSCSYITFLSPFPTRPTPCASPPAQLLDLLHPPLLPFHF
jgi:hypothetical protein